MNKNSDIHDDEQEKNKQEQSMEIFADTDSHSFGDSIVPRYSNV